MNYYETLYIVHPALESGRLKDIILSLEESLKNFGGKTLSIDLWGKKRLAYLIDKQKYGTYVQLQFTGEGNCTSSFGMELEHNPNILSYLTTLIEESDINEQEDDLDTQIAGQSREPQRIESSTENVGEKSPENNKSNLAKTGSDDSMKEPIQKSAEAINEKDTAVGDEVDNSKEISKTEEIDTSENNIDSVIENQEKNADETTAVSEEE